MDPLSIIASVITVTAVVTDGLAKVKALHYAPREIDELLNEISDLQIVVHEVHKALKERELTTDWQLTIETAANLTTILTRVQLQLRELNRITNKLISESALSGKLKYARLTWLRYKPRVQDIRTELVGLKLSLSALWGTTNSIDLSRIHLRLEEISLLTTTLVTGQKQTPKGPFHVVTNGTNTAELDLARSAPELQEQHSHAESDLTVTRVTPGMSFRMNFAALISAPPSGTIDVQTSKSACPRWCSCKCHKTRSLNSPELLNKVFGALSFGYKGVPYISETCNEKLCKRYDSSSIRVTYRFPSWLLARVLLMSFSSSVGAPEMSLRTLRVIPTQAEIFRLVINGDINGVKSMFTKGEASIYDVDDKRWSLVHKAFLVGQVEVCQFLIEQGSDIEIEAEDKSSIIDRAWFYDRTQAMLPSKTSNLHRRILELTDIEGFAEAKQHSVFHKIILGLSRLDLRLQLEHSTATIDDPDSEGFTALWWASARGDVEAVRLLLSHGASPISADREAHGPLHVAAKPEIVQLLVDYGTDVDTRDWKGRTPLHSWSYKGESRGGSSSLVEAFLDRGADVNARTRAGHTALHYVSMYGYIEILPLLLCRGALIESRKYGDGYTPLMDAIRCSQPSAVRCLIQNGADYTAKTFRDETILHICARTSNYATIRTLAAARISDIDIDAKDSSGMTARDHLEQRSVQSREVSIAMEDLFNSIRQHYVSVVPPSDGDDTSDSDESELYEDALSDLESGSFKE